MMAALCYLQFHTVKNRLWARLRRLKRPRYLFGALFAAAYFYFFIIRNLSTATAGVAAGSPYGPAMTMTPDLRESLGALCLLVVAGLLGWVMPNQRAALVFTETEVNFLFPAPITRRGLIRYKLARSQFAILVSTLILTALTGRWRYASHAWVAVLGWWIILSTLNLHLLAVSFARTRLLDRGLTNLWRRVLVLGVLALAAGGVVAWGWGSLPAWAINGNDYASALLRWLESALTTGPAPYLLLPFRLVVRPYLAPDAAGFFLALGPALLLLAAHYWWVMRAEVAFEEDSVALSQKIAERVAAFRAGRGLAAQPKKARRDPFNLAPTGFVPIAFLWKNLLHMGHFFTARTMLILLVLTLVLGGSMALPAMMMASADAGHGALPLALVVGGLCLWLLAMSFFMGPNFMRQDFRTDLAVVDLLKLYPLPGWQIVLGEMLAPAVVLTVMQWLLGLFAALLMNFPGDDAPRLGTRLAWALALALVAPLLNLVSLLIPNAAALLLPGWTRIGKDAPRGIETSGQFMLIGLAQMLALALALLPAGLGFAFALIVLNVVLGPAVAALGAALTAAAILAAEGALGVHLLGQFFEHQDFAGEVAA